MTLFNFILEPKTAKRIFKILLFSILFLTLLWVLSEPTLLRTLAIDAILIVLILSVLFGYIYVVHNADKDLYKNNKLPLYLKQNLFNPSEKALFLELKNRLSSDYYIAAKVRLADVLQPNEQLSLKFFLINRKKLGRIRKKLGRMHIDFVIYNRDFSPVLAIELDGGYHKKFFAINNDKIKNQVFANSGLKLIRLKVGDNFAQKVNEIIDILR